VRRQHQITMVYSRRRARRRAAAPAPPSPSPSSPATEFIKKLSRSPGGTPDSPHQQKEEEEAGATKQGASPKSPYRRLPCGSCRGMPAAPKEASHACS
jgi:hypothetical protein